MPLTRYQIRNEYGLADPELYRAADKDDPEALLEGVAMAGLVGVLRQLGDLAEFAAEIFHDLHEEVMATAARGHGLMARVQQLEAEFPSIEKALLSQTDHSAFFTNSGIEWRPNLRSEQGLITRGDLPRFVMDSYEESRGPPRLFLLDKFDVAGAGACLKRYTDPSLFKVEAAASGISTVETQREKKIRKVKKKGSRWRNGGNTPEVVPTSNTKLHELFLEERIENGHPDPARLVKLKRRQLHGSPFDARAGKSYMEKFIETPSPENKAVCEVSVNPPLLKLTSDYSSESGLEIHEISTVSPEKKWSPEKERNLLSPSSEEVVLKPVTNELNLEVIDKGTITVSDQSADGGETYESPSTIHKMAIEEESAVDVNGKIDGSLDGDHSDGMISEVDNYMDALTTMESEMETDNEYKYKNDQRVLNVGKCWIDSHVNEEQLDAQANFSDCQSIGNFSLSDDGNSSSKNQKSISSNSGSFANSAKNALSDGEGAGKVASTENFQSENADLLSDYPSEHVESIGTECHDLVASNGTGMEEPKISDLGEASKSSCPEDSNPMLQPSVPTEEEETPFDPVAIGSRSMNSVKSGTDLDDPSVVTSNFSIQTSNDPSHAVSSESNLVDESDQEDLHMSSDAFVHASNVLELDSERKGSNGPMNEEMFFKENVGASVTSQPDSSGVAQNAELVSEIDDAISGVVTNSEGLTIIADNLETDINEDDQSSGVIDNISQVEVDSIKMKHEDVSGVADHEEIVESSGNVDCLEGDAVPCEHPSEYLHEAGVDDCRSTDDATETAQTEDAAASTVISSGTNDDGIDNVTYPSLDVTSQNLTDELESICGPMDPQQRLLESHEAVAPECYIESEAPEEVKQEEVSPKDLDSVPYASVSNDHSNPEETKQVCYSPLDSYHQSDSLVSDSTVEPCLEQSQEFKSNSADQSHSVGASENDLSLPSCDVSDAETSLNKPMGLVDETSVHVEDPFSDEANCKLLDLQTSPDIDLGKPQILSEQTLDSKYEQHDSGHLQLDEANSRSSNLSAEQMQSLSHMDHGIHVDTSCPEDLSSHKLPLQSTGREHNDTKLTMNPFDSAFPSFGLLPEATQVNLEMPPLPPLPPMQWRMVKNQLTPQPAERESDGHSRSAFTPMQPFALDEKAQFTSDHCHGTFPPMQTCTPDDKDQFAFPMSGTENMQLSNPFLSAKFTDDGRSQAFSANSVENSLQPTPISLEIPAVISNVNGQHEMGPLEGTQSSNPFLTATEKPSEKPEHSSFESQGESVESNSSAFSAVSSAEDTASGQDHLPHGPPIQSLDQLTRETGFERKVNEHSSQCSEKEQGKSPDKCIESVSTVEEQQQHDLASSKGESTWLPVTSLGLPPTYEAGKQNGNRLPRPRNPLIDAVAAHDKSKLRKVAERVRPQIGPKVEERDSLLEQIRTKSFNLKPATVTRPSIQGIQGPKTNLKVAAILEKASAIRQALAGSDEDEDSDSWSDS